MNIVAIIIFLVVIFLWWSWLSTTSSTHDSENYSSLSSDASHVQNYIVQDNAQYAGINMLGTVSNDSYFAGTHPSECMYKCDINPSCAAWSFYKPGNRCYMFSADGLSNGGFIDGRPDFISGTKVN